MLSKIEIIELAERRAKAHFLKMGKDEKAEAGLFKLVIGLFIIVILASALMPTAITMITGANKTYGNNTPWDASTIATWNALPIFVVIVLLAVLAGIAYRAFND